MTTPANYRSESVRISKSINDDHWVMEMPIDKTTAPALWESFQVELDDHASTSHMRFLGLIPGSSYTLSPVDNRAIAVGYDQSWYLSQQYISSDMQNMGLADDSGWNDWDDVIEDILGGTSWATVTGIEPYRLNNPGSSYADKRFSFKAKTTKMQAIRKIAEYCGFLFVIKPRWTGSEWRSSAYFVSIDDIDDGASGLDLPSPVTFTHPDDYVVNISHVDDLGDDRYNRIIVRGHDGAGTWYTATEESADVTAGTALAREYYEESADYDTQAKCDARAQELYSLFNLVVKTATVEFTKRHDLELLQQIRFVSYDSCMNISETYYRIIEISYEQAAVKDTVRVTCTPDRLKCSTWYADRSQGDMISETQIVAEEVVRTIPAGETGSVSAVSGSDITVDLERGGTIIARAVDGTPSVSDDVSLIPLSDGTFAVAGSAGGGGGGVSDPMTTYLNMGGNKIYLYKAATDAASMYIVRDGTSGNMIFHIPQGEAVEWQVG